MDTTHYTFSEMVNMLSKVEGDTLAIRVGRMRVHISAYVVVNLARRTDRLARTMAGLQRAGIPADRVVALAATDGHRLVVRKLRVAFNCFVS